MWKRVETDTGITGREEAETRQRKKQGRVCHSEVLTLLKGKYKRESW